MSSKTSNQKLRTIEIDLAYKTVAQAIQYLQGLQTTLPDDAAISVDVEDDYGSTVPKIEIYYYEPETQLEREQRWAREKQAKEFRRQQYLNLKKEFEKEKK